MIFDATPLIPFSLSVQEAEYLLELLKEEKEILEPFYDQVEWAHERLNMLDALIDRLEVEV